MPIGPVWVLPVSVMVASTLDEEPPLGTATTTLNPLELEPALLFELEEICELELVSMLLELDDILEALEMLEMLEMLDTSELLEVTEEPITHMLLPSLKPDVAQRSCG